MKIQDNLYGDFEISEPVLIELINSKAIQRLKGVSQLGLPDEYFHIKGFSRFDHSIGTMLLLRKLGASLKEQIAGLLHDVSHTAFSHLTELLLGDPSKDNFQDDNMLSYIKKTNIPFILKKYSYDYLEICDTDNFSLLESSAPNLCADRVDYGLREMLNFEKDTKKIVDSLINYDGKIIFNSKGACETFSLGYAKCQRDDWGSDEAKVRHQLMAEILKDSLDKGIINFDDFWKTDNEIIYIVRNKGSVKAIEKLNLLAKRFKIIGSKKNTFGYKKKFRYVDPEINIGSKLIRLSELSASYKKLISIEMEESNKVKFFEIVK